MGAFVWVVYRDPSTMIGDWIGDESGTSIWDVYLIGIELPLGPIQRLGFHV